MKDNIDDIIDTLERPTYLQNILCIINGKNYATAIAKELNKNHSTVSGQLYNLEKLGLIKRLKRDKANRYCVQWNVILECFYTYIERGIKKIINHIRNDEGEVLTGFGHLNSELANINVRKTLHPDFIMHYFKTYSQVFSLLVDKSREDKSFSDFVHGFFLTLSNMVNPEKDSKANGLEKILEEYDVDKDSFYFLIGYMKDKRFGIEVLIMPSFLESSLSNNLDKTNEKEENDRK